MLRHRVVFGTRQLNILTHADRCATVTVRNYEVHFPSGAVTWFGKWLSREFRFVGQSGGSLRTAMFGTLTPTLSSFSGSASGLLGTSTTATPPKHTSRKSTSGPPSLGPISRAVISLEYASLRYQSHCPLGMYVIPLVDDPSIWDGVLFIHQGEHLPNPSASLRKLKSFPRQGYYTDSILRFRLTFPHNYPEQPPAVHFITDVFHPLISHRDGTFNLAPKFNPWRSVTLPHQVSFITSI